MVVYGPNEGESEEKERLWKDLDRIVDRIGNGYRLCVLGDLSRRIGDRLRQGITGAFGVPGENDNGRRVVEFCAERELCVGYMYFERKSLHRYTRMAKDQHTERR